MQELLLERNGLGTKDQGGYDDHQAHGFVENDRLQGWQLE